MGEIARAGEIEVHVDGAGDETIVMVHGWPDTHRLWDAQVAGLKDRYRCARFTLPGFEHGAPHRAWTLDELLAAIGAVVDRVSPDRPVILMLHDWGCVFGYEYCMRNPARVARVVGVDIGDPSSLARSLDLRGKLMVIGYQVILALAWLLRSDGLARVMARALGCRTEPQAITAQMGYPYYMTWFGGADSYRRHSHGFRPQCPVLFIYGRRKPLMFHATSWLDTLRARPGSAAVEFDTGHWVMRQQPERFNQVVGDWLAGGRSA